MINDINQPRISKKIIVIDDSECRQELRVQPNGSLKCQCTDCLGDFYSADED